MPMPPLSSRAQRATLIAAVFYANLVSLAAQVIWVRKITLLLGATAGVFASVLAVMLTGLACGAMWGGRRAAAQATPRRWLAALLVILGVLCALSLPLLDLARAIFLAIAPAGVGPTMRAIARLPVIALVLLPPTLTIGAILPMATQLYGRISAGAVSALYAADTLGAAAGALAAGFVLVPHLGLGASTWLLAAGALAMAALVARRPAEGPAVEARARPPAAVIKRKKKAKGGSPAAVAAAKPKDEGELSRRARAAVLASFFLTGAAALLLETGWNRYFYLLTGTSIFSLSTVLAGFLTGIGLGSALVRKRIERGNGLLILVAFLQTMVAAGGILVFRARELFERVYLALFQGTESFGGFQLGVYLTVFVLVALATVPMGANFPVVVRLLTKKAEGEAGTRGEARTLGGVYFINTLGAVAGALAGEFLILPRWGFGGLLATVTAIYLGSAGLFWRLAPAKARRRAALGLAPLAGFALLLSPPLRSYEPPWNALYYSGIRQGSYANWLALNGAHRVVFRRQGFYGQVTVSQTPSDLYLKHNGKTDASTSSTDRFAQGLLGHLPLLLHPRPERVANIGLGGGLTLAAITAHPEPREISLIELDPLVVEATHTWFADANRRALDDPRVRVILDDGRNFIDRGGEKFDVVISEPPNIWVAGVSGLFTEEFYRAVKSRLRPGGILCQWLPLYELTESDFATAVATIGSQFEHIDGWTNGSVAILLASAQPLPTVPARPAATLPAAVVEDLAQAGVEPSAIDAFVSNPDMTASTLAGIRRMAPTLNVDDRPVLEFQSARNLYRLNKPGAERAWTAGLQRPR
jgi:predicted membrane-bound spermidine synthase